MKFGIAFANTGPFTDPARAIEFAQAAEAAGFESLWTVEHVIVPSNYESAYPYDPSGKMPGSEEMPIPDPLIWLAYLAAATSRINLATGVVILPQRILPKHNTSPERPVRCHRPSAIVHSMRRSCRFPVDCCHRPARPLIFQPNHTYTAAKSRFQSDREFDCLPDRIRNRRW